MTTQSLITRRLRSRALLFFCAVLSVALISEAAPQSRSGKRSRRGGERSAHKQFSPGEAREFVSLATKAFSWSKSEQTSVLPPSAEKVADFFGLSPFRAEQFRLRARRPDASTNLYAQAGMAFLSALDSKQRDKLKGIAAEQERAFPQHAALHSQILEQLQRGRVNFADQEKEVIRLATERRQAEGAIALTQARGFRALSLTMSREQMDYLVNFRRGLTAKPFVAYGAAEAADLTASLKRLPKESRLRLLETAEEAFNWMTGNLAANLAVETADIAPFFQESASMVGDPQPTTPPKDAGMSKYGKGKTGNPFEGLAGMLDWRQRRVVRGLMEEEKPLFARFIADRKLLAAELYKLRTGENMNPNATSALAKRLGETEGKIVLLQAKTFGYLDNVFRPDQMARVRLPKLSPASLASKPRVVAK